MRVEDGGRVTPRPGRERLRGGRRIDTEEIAIGEWSLTAASWTDRHRHEETNWVLEGELHVNCEGRTAVVQPGHAVIVPPEVLATYWAPVYARMLFIYGPSDDGHTASDGRYEELPVAPQR